MKKSFRIWSHGEKDLVKAMNRLNKHALKMGYTEVKIISISKEFETRRTTLFKSADGEVSESFYAVTVKDVEVDIPEQFLNMADAEWKVVGQVISADGQAEVVAEEGQLVKLGKFIENYNWKCQACKHPLKRSFVVENRDDSRLLSVGVECLKQYTGADGQAIIALIEFISVLQIKETDGEGGSGGGGSAQNLKVIDLEEYLTMCAAVARQQGGYKKRWVKDSSYSDYGEEVSREIGDCTRNVALAQFLGTLDPNGLTKRMFTKNGFLTFAVVVPTEADKARGAELLKLWQGSPVLPRFDGTEDEYAEQCKFLAERGWITEKTAGIAASMVNGPRQPSKPSASVFVGTIGVRGEFKNLKVVFTKTIVSEFGETKLIKFEDPSGNVYTWFASNPPAYDIGWVFDVKASVKDHNEFRGDKQTILTRCKLVEVSK